MSWFRRWVNVLKPQPGSVLTGVSEPSPLVGDIGDFGPLSPEDERLPDALDIPPADPYLGESEPLADWELELLEEDPPLVTVNSLWKRNPPGKQVVRVGRVWAKQVNILSTTGVQVEWLVRAAPVRGGKVLVADIKWFVENYTKQSDE